MYDRGDESRRVIDNIQKAVDEVLLRIQVGDKKEKHSYFFQAEDGIRDKLVNGVQTCALPI